MPSSVCLQLMYSPQTFALASEVAGNIGMLGQSYPGYFPVGDVGALVSQLINIENDIDYCNSLSSCCDLRKSLFSINNEKACWQKTLSNCCD